jgi:hypothetical protein
MAGLIGGEVNTWLLLMLVVLVAGLGGALLAAVRTR